MQQTDSQEMIKELDKSGAGLSSTRVFLAKHIFFPILNRSLSWKKAWDIFDKEGQKIIALASTLNKEQLFERVLVPKLLGLEDNSRYYSCCDEHRTPTYGRWCFANSYSYFE